MSLIWRSREDEPEPDKRPWIPTAVLVALLGGWFYYELLRYLAGWR